jgi:hypothetical protein
MPDWKRLVEERLATLQVGCDDREQVCTEIANHLEDRFEHCLAAGMSADDSEKEALSAIVDWKSFAKNLARERKTVMTMIGKQLILPSGVALGLATASLALEIGLGPRPAIWVTNAGAFVVYKIWPLALMLTGACSAWLAGHAGASKARRALVAVTPALYMLGAMLCVVASVFAMNLLKGMPSQRIYWIAILTGLANWVALPGAALLVGALPFLGGTEQQIRIAE